MSEICDENESTSMLEWMGKETVLSPYKQVGV
jgi:hypothetical protein